MSSLLAYRVPATNNSDNNDRLILPLLPSLLLFLSLIIYITATSNTSSFAIIVISIIHYLYHPNLITYHNFPPSRPQSSGSKVGGSRLGPAAATSPSAKPSSNLGGWDEWGQDNATLAQGQFWGFFFI